MITETIGILAGILSIWQFATKGKDLTLRLGNKSKIDNWNGFEVF